MKADVSYFSVTVIAILLFLCLPAFFGFHGLFTPTNDLHKSNETGITFLSIVASDSILCRNSVPSFACFVGILDNFSNLIYFIRQKASVAAADGLQLGSNPSRRSVNVSHDYLLLRGQVHPILSLVPSFFPSTSSGSKNAQSRNQKFRNS